MTWMNDMDVAVQVVASGEKQQIFQIKYFFDHNDEM